jgi:hypothetical protein
VGLLKKWVVAVGTVGIMAAVIVPTALAQSPWWHLTSGSRPSYLRGGLAKNEIQKLTVKASEGEFKLREPVRLHEALEGKRNSSELLQFTVPYNVSASELQTRLEGEFYGAGSVRVSEAAGDTPESHSWEITFTGSFADQPVQPIEASNESLVGLFEEPSLSVAELTRGQSDGELVITAENTGDANATGSKIPVQIADKLPAGLKAVAITGDAPLEGGFGKHTLLECSLGSVSCTSNENIAPYEQLEVRIAVVVEGALSGELNEVGIGGGGAPSTSIRRPIRISGDPTPFGVENYELTNEEAGGAEDRQSGSHPFEQTTTITLNQEADGEPPSHTVLNNPSNPVPIVKPVALAKDLNFKWPAGLIGNPTAVPRCTMAQFLTEDKEGNECKANTAVGVAAVTFDTIVGFVNTSVPLFNLEPEAGEPARLGFIVAKNNPVLINASVRTGDDYGITVSVPNITQSVTFLSSQVSVWGVPGDPRHDAQRGWGCLGEDHDLGSHLPCDALEEQHPQSFLSLPTSCSGSPLTATVESDSWVDQGNFSPPVGEPMPILDGCNRLPFSASIGVASDVQEASTPTGLTVHVHVPQEESLNGTGLAVAAIKDTTVALPEGVTINPAGADGLEACSESEIGYLPGVSTPPRELHFTDGLPAPKGAPSEQFCPDASKIGTVKLKLPILPNELEGAVYLASQDANPFGSLIAMYIVAEDPVSGVLVKLPGEVKLLSQSGQVIATFLNTPQAPAEDLELHFFGGDRAPLSTPPLCGTYQTTGQITPWSGNPPVPISSTFQITSGPSNGPCPNPPGDQSLASLPFNPSLTAGTTSIQAGGFSPFTMTMSREDGQQNLQAVQLHMPPGLSGLLSSVKLCPEPQADLGTCGPESQIGETIVSVGLGSNPFSVTGGKVFITGGYGGAPYGLSIVNPAKAGPFDLGTVVVRAKIEVDPITAALTITTDDTGPYKIPTILDGIPLEIKHINVTINRPGFTFNPTNCDPMSITGSLSSVEGATKTLSVPLQVTNCATLGFKPGFSVSTTGKTSRANGASLHVKLTYPKAPFGSQANIRQVKVDLPKQLPSRLSTLQKACTIQTFEQNPASCPNESRVGTASATTPLLPVPLAGPAYFVSHAGLKFPELVIVLSGYGTTIQLHAETFISKTGITSSTFRTVPDAPVGTFELTLPQGRYSALAANTNLCKSTLKMPTAFTAQNGATIKQSTPIAVTGCPKKAKKASKRHRATLHGKKK